MCYIVHSICAYCNIVNSYNIVQFAVYTSYNTVHCTLPCCAPARLLCWILASPRARSAAMHSHPKSLDGALIFNRVRRRQPTQPLPLWQGRRRLAAASPRDVKGYSRRVWLVVVGQGVEKIVDVCEEVHVTIRNTWPKCHSGTCLFVSWMACQRTWYTRHQALCREALSIAGCWDGSETQPACCSKADDPHCHDPWKLLHLSITSGRQLVWRWRGTSPWAWGKAGAGNQIAHVFMLVKSPTWRLYVPQRACSEQGGICVLGEVLTGQHVIPGCAQPPVLDAACI